MRAARQRAYRRGAAPRLVRLSRLGGTIGDLDARRGMVLTAYAVGLRAVGHMRRLFPDFYRTHVEQLTITAPVLCAVTETFVALASQDLVELADTYDICPHRDPLVALQDREAEDVALDVLTEQLWVYVDEPPCAVYGVGGDFDDLFYDGGNLLALGIWRVVNHTAFGFMHPMDEIAQMCVAAQTAHMIGDLPLLPRDTPMEQLVAALDQQPPVNGVQLGTLLRYVCQQTGNVFADYTHQEIMEDIGGGASFVDWRSDISVVQRDQRQAAALRAQYEALDEAVRADHGLLQHIAITIAETAAVLPERSPYLVDTLGDAPVEAEIQDIYDPWQGDENDGTIILEETPVAAAEAAAVPV